MPYTKYDSKHVKFKTIKVFEENVGDLHDRRLAKEFLDMPPKATYIKDIIDKLNFIKMKMFSSANNTIKKIKIQARD